MHLDTWTFVLQAANFLVLAWLLNRFLYRPVTKLVAERQAAAAALRTQAVGEASKAEALRRELETERAGIDAERQKAMQAAHEAALAERQAVLTRAREESAKLSAETKAALERERTEAAADLGRDAARLACVIARRVLIASPHAGMQRALLEEALDQVRALPAEERRRMTSRAAPGEGRCVVTTAEPLSPIAEKRFSAKLAAAAGSEIACEFRVDADLIAGVELRFPFTRIRRAWADDLARLGGTMTHDEPTASVA